jgi:pyruvate kinase
MALRATKIVATLGPASSDPALLEEMIKAGVNVVRLNFSHGTAQDHIDRGQSEFGSGAALYFGRLAHRAR